MASTTTITNTSKQVIPVLVGSIAITDASPNSSIPPQAAEQVAIASGASLVIETGRVDIGQLTQLQNMRLISFTSF